MKKLFARTAFILLFILICCPSVLSSNYCDPNGGLYHWWCNIHNDEEGDVINAFHDIGTTGAEFPPHSLYCADAPPSYYADFVIRNLDVNTGWYPWNGPETTCQYCDDMTPIEWWTHIECDYANHLLYFHQGDTCEDTDMRIGRFCARGIITVDSQYYDCDTSWQIILNSNYY